MEELEKVKISAYFDAGRTMPALMQLIGYRQNVAQNLLNSNGETHEELMEIYNYTNDQIKKVMGL